MDVLVQILVPTATLLFGGLGSSWVNEKPRAKFAAVITMTVSGLLVTGCLIFNYAYVHGAQAQWIANVKSAETHLQMNKLGFGTMLIG